MIQDAELTRIVPICTFQAHKDYLTRVLLSPDVKHLATCSADTTVKIWSVSPNYDFKVDKVLQGHQRWVWDCAFSADSAYLVTGKEVSQLLRTIPGLLRIPLKASSDHTARLWEMASGETVRQYNGHHKGF